MALGQWGEKTAEKYLIRKGLSIIERNYRCKSGEIDLIARNGTTLVFIEVKTRSNLCYGLPCESITQQKLRHLKNAIQFYMKANRIETCDLRVDVIEILYRNGQVFLRHIENVS